MPGRRIALLIINSNYEHQLLRTLPSAAQDGRDLQGVLGSPQIGDFEVQTLSDEPSYRIIAAIENLTADRESADLILIHFSGHGLKDKDGKLYIAGRNTRPDRLMSTAVPASQINDLLFSCRSGQKILVFDCCFGGAFLRGVVPRSAEGRVGVLEKFPEGRGTVVITSSDAIQYAYEGETINGAAVSSAFTSVFVRGLRTGKADLNSDGRVGLTELFQYITERMRQAKASQTPEINNFRLQSEIFIARSRNQSIEIPLTWEEAREGGKKTISTGQREEVINIPPNIKDGVEQDYEGLGASDPDGGQPGDLAVTFRVGPPPANVIQLQQRRNRLTLVILSILAPLVLLVGLAISSLDTGWRPEPIASHWPKGSAGGSVTYQPSPDGRPLFSGLFWGKPFVRMWDAATGTAVKSTEGNEFGYYLGGTNPFILVGRKSGEPVAIVDLKTWSEEGTPFLFDGSSLPEINQDGSVLYNATVQNDDPSCSFNGVANVSIWSRMDKKPVQRIVGIPTGNELSYSLYNSVDRLLATCRVGKGLAPCLWNSDNGGLIANLLKEGNDGAAGSDGATVNLGSKFIATWKQDGKDAVPVRLWSLETGELLHESEPIAERDTALRKRLSFEGGGLRFNADGSLVFVGGASTEPWPIYVLGTANLAISDKFQIPPSGAQWVSGPKGDVLLWTAKNTDAEGYNLDSGSVFSLVDFDLQTVKAAMPVGKNPYVAIVRDSGQAEIWDFTRFFRVRSLQFSSRVEAAGRVLGDGGVYFALDEGRILIYDVSGERQIAAFNNNNLGNSFEIAYDGICNFVYVWREDGEVERFSKQLSIFGINLSGKPQCARQPTSSDSVAK